MAVMNLSRKLISDHLLSGSMTPGSEVGLKIDHILLQDATGTLVMLELEAIGLDRVKTEVAVQYVDHNLLQTDFKNMDDHRFLQSAAKRFGFWYSRPGNGISHVVHMEQFGKPGKSLLGSDSHTPAAGGIGMLAMGTGGVDVALAAAGEPYYVRMPKVMGIRLTGNLMEWVSAKDVVLEMLRRHDVSGGRGYILEYYGPGLKNLSAWDRHVIANMGTELGATTSVFPSDERTREFFRQQGREDDWSALAADEGADYDKHEEIDLSTLEPLVARPGSPGDVVPVREVAGAEVNQVVIGSSANPSLRDFWVVAETLRSGTLSPDVSLDVNPTSRQILQNLTDMGSLGALIAGGARIHQSGCMGCIGMGQAPAAGTKSLRTMPRNFPGRSGTSDDEVYLCSPETAVATALSGTLTDPRTLTTANDISYPQWKEPEGVGLDRTMMIAPNGERTELVKGRNISSIPDTEPPPDEITLPILLRMGDNVSTDEILKAGSDVLPLRSNIPEISKYAYHAIDPDFYERARENHSDYDGFCVIAGANYAQGSSREHAALAPRYLGQRLCIAKSYARIGWQNLINFGIIPFVFAVADEYDDIDQGDVLTVTGVRAGIREGKTITASVSGGKEIRLSCSLSERQKAIILAGGVIPYIRSRRAA